MIISSVYIISQIITIFYYGMLSISFLIKGRIKILWTNFVAHLGQAVAMGMLKGYTGSCMSIVMMTRDLVFVIVEKMKSRGINVSNKVDNIILVMSIILISVLTFISYNGFLSLLSVFATIVSTIAVWQKSTKVYRWLGLFGGILWLLYEIYIRSIMGAVLEIMLVTSSIIGIYKGYRDRID